MFWTRFGTPTDEYGSGTEEEIEIMLPDGTNLERKVLAMEDENRQPVESAPHPKQEIWIDFGEPLKEGWLLRRKE